MRSRQMSLESKEQQHKSKKCLNGNNKENYPGAKIKKSSQTLNKEKPSKEVFLSGLKVDNLNIQVYKIE